uniref:Uncharacterized protein n=1 Tax=Arundo donax TaxID=35708 RepID=A0A0A8Y1G4_ARUDO
MPRLHMSIDSFEHLDSFALLILDLIVIPIFFLFKQLMDGMRFTI